jgi:hypothetical protein
VQQYEANARAELYLRERSPGAKEAIDGTIVGQANAVGSLANSASAVVATVRQATNDLRHLANKALPAAAGADRNTTSHGEFASDDLPIAARSGALVQIDAGALEPDPDSRLGAYAATTGYPPGTVGEAVHNAIGTIDTTLGTAGQEQIGKVFNSPQARALYGKPLTPETSRQIAQIEYDYWSRVRADNPRSPSALPLQHHPAPSHRPSSAFEVGVRRAALPCLGHGSTCNPSSSTSVYTSHAARRRAGSTRTPSGEWERANGSFTAEEMATACQRVAQELVVPRKRSA